MVYVALLRGINVGGKTMVNMATLKQCFENLGFASVRTYINSGNVVFKTSKKNPRELESAIEKVIEDRFKFPVTVVVRNLAEYERLINQIPSNWESNSNLKCNIIFLHHSIDKSDILDGIELKEQIESATYYPGVIFWAAKTGDLTKSNMVKLSSRPIYKNMTVRNLNTSRKIFQLMQETDKT